MMRFYAPFITGTTPQVTWAVAKNTGGSTALRHRIKQLLSLKPLVLLALVSGIYSTLARTIQTVSKNHFSRFFCDGQGWRVRVSRSDARHNRSIRNSQANYPKHSEPLIDHCHWVIRVAHLTCAHLSTCRRTQASTHKQ